MKLLFFLHQYGRFKALVSGGRESLAFTS